MIGNEIQYLTQAVLSESRDQVSECLGVAKFRIELCVADNVIAVGTPRPRPQVGRAIHMADTEAGQIWRYLRGVNETKIAIELKPIGCKRCTVMIGALRGL